MQKPRPTLAHRFSSGRRAEDPNLTLIEQAKAGNLQAFEQLWRQHEAKANAVVCSQLQCRSDAASEVIRQVRINALHAIGHFKVNASFPNWLCQIAHETASGYRQRRMPRHEGSLAGAGSAGQLRRNGKCAAEMLVIAERVIETMELRQQKILQLVCWEKRSPAEVAESLDIKSQDVFETVKMFRTKLRRNMKEPN